LHWRNTNKIFEKAKNQDTERCKIRRNEYPGYGILLAEPTILQVPDWERSDLTQVFEPQFVYQNTILFLLRQFRRRLRLQTHQHIFQRTAKN
jgi:hypothetical protein